MIICSLSLNYFNSISLYHKKHLVISNSKSPINYYSTLILLKASSLVYKIKFNRSFHSTKPSLKRGHVRKVLDLANKYKPLPNLTLTFTPISNLNNNAEANLIPKDVSLSKSTIGFLNRLVPKPLYRSLSPQIDVGVKTTVTSPRDQLVGSEVITRNMALRIRDFKNPDELQHSDDKSPVDLHLKKHSVVFNDTTNKVQAILTSCKKDSIYEFLNTVKVDGLSTGQHLKALSNPRGVNSNELKIPEKTNPQYPIHKYESWNEDRMHDIIEPKNKRDSKSQKKNKNTEWETSFIDQITYDTFT